MSFGGQCGYDCEGSSHKLRAQQRAMVKVAACSKQILLLRICNPGVHICVSSRQ